MNNTEKLAVLEEILYKAAEDLGDINPRVMEEFYLAYPAALPLFIEHGGMKKDRLENDMVESAVYCLMSWFENPAEIEIMFSHTVPHHEILNIPPEFFSGLLMTTMSVIEKTLTDSDEVKLAVWTELKTKLLSLVNDSSLSSMGM